MSKALKIAAIIVGVASVVLTAGASLGIIGPVILGMSTAALAAGLALASTVLTLASGALAKPPKGLASTGQQLDWRADMAAGEPYVMGDAMIGASIVHQASWGDKNKYLGLVGILSICTITGYDGLYADMTQVTFSGRNATGYFHDFMYLSTQLGALPEAAALDMTAPDSSMMPDWGSTYKTSGLGSVGLIMVADIKDGKIYSGGAPKLTNRIRGVKAYDARADSTVTGGSGSQRALTESTYAYSENPWVHAETYALGRWQNGINVIGPGLPADKINFASFMEAATIADAHSWKVSGQIYSTDPKWDALKAMCQAGGGVPMPTQAHLSCLVNAPKVSLATITEADVKGPVSAPQMLTRRQRLNGAIPRYRSADHGWEIIPGDAVRNSTWLADDGGKPSTREIEFALVADKGDGAGKTQAAQLAAYAVANTRERGPISVELGYVWSQYKLGDCLTLDLPKARLNSQKCVVIGRSVNVAKNTITLEFQTEDDAKHTWALGVAGTVTAPPTVAQPPGTGDGVETDLETQNFILGSGMTGMTFSVTIPAGGNTQVTIGSHTRVYSDKSVSVNGNGGPVAVAAASGDAIYAYYDDTGRAGGAVTYHYLVLAGGTGDASSAFPSPTNPYRHNVFSWVVPASGGSISGGSDPGTGGGGGGGRFDLGDTR
jgi:hypothetical protein